MLFRSEAFVARQRNVILRFQIANVDRAIEGHRSSARRKPGLGEIEDEFDITEPRLAPGAASMALDGSVNIRDLESQYHIALPRDEGFETLAGFMLAQLQKIPEVGDSFEYQGRRYTVAAMDGLRVVSVNIEGAEPQSQVQPSSATPLAQG